MSGAGHGRREPYIGRAMPRFEDLRLVAGRGRFSDDAAFPGQAYASFVRSPHAHARLGTIDIAGYNMASSGKYKNVRGNPKVAFTVDDAPGEGPAGVRFLEIRGLAETVTVAAGDSGSLPPEIIRIHPRRVLSFNVDPTQHGLATRDISPAADNQVS